MPVQIVAIPAGVANAYALKSAGVVAIDAGAPGKVDLFARGLARAGIQPHDVRLIVLTHGHWDHVGSAREVKALTGAKLAIHERDRTCIENALVPIPPGVTTWGRIFIAIERLFVPLIKFPATPVDIVLGDDGLSLHEYGVPGRVLFTPGHSPGSVSVLLDSGEAFVGDLAMNNLPLRLTPGLPIIAEDAAQVVESWQRLLQAGARTIYPGHGKPFSADVMRRAIAV